MGNKLVIAKHLRHQLRRGLARARFGKELLGMPVLFANAFPKSGTHLLTQILHGLTHLGPAVDSGLPAMVMYDGQTGQPRPLQGILSDLARLHPGDIAYGHLHALPEIVELLCRQGTVHFFLYRDPRDVVVSHVHYVTGIETTHVHHDFYRSLPDFNTRLRTSILGRPGLDVPFPDIRARFEPYLGWLDHPQVCALRFEDLIGAREAAITRVIEHATAGGFPQPGRGAVRTLIGGMRPDRSPTFRSGKVGGWQSVFTTEHKRLFKNVAGDLLVRLGYEQNDDW